MSNEPKAEILDDDLKDGMENLIAQLGTEQDKRHHSRFVNSKGLSQEGSQEELNAMYRTDWLSGKVVDIVPADMTREWRTFDGEIEPEVIKRLTDEEDRLGLRNAFEEAHKWARLYGTAFIVMSVDDGQTPDKPLIISKVRKGGLRHIKVIDRHRIDNAQVIPTTDPLDANYGLPEKYRFKESNVVIHHSRLIRFDGIKLPYDELRRNNYFSDSVLDRLYESITNLNTVTHGSAAMVYETNVDIMKVKGLMNYLQSAEGEALLRKRFTLAGMLKSFNNMMLLDSEEDWASKNNTFSGLPELIDRFSQLLSAASDIPATRLLGVSASGFNATGEGDLKNYYDKIRSDQISRYKPKLDYFDRIMLASLGMNPEEDVTYEFNSLFQMTPKEQADVDFVNAQRDQIYLTNGVVSEVIVAKELMQKATYTNIEDHIELLEEFEEDLDGFNTNTDPAEFGNDEETPEGKDEEDESSEESEES